MKVAVLGAGAWGTALALHLSGRHDVSLWVWDPKQLEAMRASRESPFLPGHALPGTIAIEADTEGALDGAGLALVVVPMAALRETLARVAGSRHRPVAVIASKGFEAGTTRLAHQVAEEVLGGRVPTAVLSGPSFALEVARGLPTAVTLAARDGEFAAATARELHSPRFRVYSSTDVAGVEVGGAVKNVIAIAAGISDGLDYGYNARAALITRGLAEITRLGLRLGGRQETFLGLSGVGDLFLTATSDLSRNRRVGLMLARGMALDAILRELGQVAEGVYTARSVRSLGDELGVEMPITEAVCRILFEAVPAKAAVEALLSREPKPEAGA